MTTKKERTIENVTYGGQSTIYHREIYEFKNLKIKLELNSGNCSIRGYANAYALDGLEWKLIYTIPFPELTTSRNLTYSPFYRDEKAANAGREFSADVQRLKKNVEEILG